MVVVKIYHPSSAPLKESDNSHVCELSLDLDEEVDHAFMISPPYKQTFQSLFLN